MPPDSCKEVIYNLLDPGVTVIPRLWRSPHDPDGVSANSGRRLNAGLMFSQRRRRWANIKPTLAECIVFASALITFPPEPPPPTFHSLRPLTSANYQKTTCCSSYLTGGFHDNPSLKDSATRKLGGALVQWLKLAAWKVGDRGLEPHSSIEVSKKKCLSPAHS